MKQFFLVIFLTGSCIQLLGQFSKDEWHEGTLVTTDGDTVRGEIQYDMEANTVQVARRNNVMAFSSHKVFYFEIYDKQYASYREFYTLPYKFKTNYETPVLFELLFEGGLSLLSREKIVQQSDYANSQFSYGPRILTNKLVFDFYFMDKKGKMTYFDGTKTQLLEIMISKRTEIKQYISQNNLKTNEIRDLVRITSFYNSI